MWSFKTWYQANKDNFNVSRKERYASDPEYRERAKRYSQESRERAARRKAQAASAASTPSSSNQGSNP